MSAVSASAVNTPESIARQLWELGSDIDEAAYLAQARKLIEQLVLDARNDENLTVGHHLAETTKSLQSSVAAERARASVAEDALDAERLRSNATLKALEIYVEKLDVVISERDTLRARVDAMLAEMM